MTLLTPPFYTIRITFSVFIATLLSAFFAEALERISVKENGDEVLSGVGVSDVTPDGRFVVLVSFASDLVAGDTNSQTDVFVLDRNDGSIELISVDSDENQPTDEGSFNGSISNDGRYVVFQSESSQLVMGDTNGEADLFLRDRTAGTTERVTLSDDDMEIDGSTFGASGEISGNGNFVAFQTSAPNVVTGDMNGVRDIFRRDLVNDSTIRVSVSNGGMEALAASTWPTISDDGNRIGFTSSAENLIADDDNGHQDMFVRDVTAGTTTRVSVTSTGAQQENGGCNESVAISANGQTVVFASSANNLLPGDTNGLTDVFVREIGSNALEIVNVASNSSTFITDGFTSFPTISPDGRYVGFQSRSTQLDPRHTNGETHGYIHDRQTKQTVTINISTTGQFADNTAVFPTGSEAPIFANNGEYVFDSDADELVPGDTDEADDVYQSAFTPVPTAAGPAPDNAALCASLKNKLKKLKKKAKKLKSSGKKAAAKKLKKKMKKIKKQLKSLGC